MWNNIVKFLIIRAIGPSFTPLLSDISPMTGLRMVLRWSVSYWQWVLVQQCLVQCNIFLVWVEHHNSVVATVVFRRSKWNILHMVWLSSVTVNSPILTVEVCTSLELTMWLVTSKWSWKKTIIHRNFSILRIKTMGWEDLCNHKSSVLLLQIYLTWTPSEMNIIN